MGPALKLIEAAPVDKGALAKFVGRKNKALATIVLSMDPGLLYYVVGADPTDPIVVWKNFLKKNLYIYIGIRSQ